MDKKNFIFTIDDNIRFFRELSEKNGKSLFTHPYLKMLKELHDDFGVKIQMNLFYQDTKFDLSAFSDKYRKEWENNSDWLKMSFHSEKEDVCPYENAGYEQVYSECEKVQREILRFAGKDSLAKTTTIHYCKTTLDGLNALKKCGIKGLLGLYGDEEDPQTSYLNPDPVCERIRAGEIMRVDGMAFGGIDIVLNCFNVPRIIGKLQRLQDRDLIKIMIHEQYFYKDYAAYQVDFREKLEKSFDFLISNGFSSCFFEDLL